MLQRAASNAYSWWWASHVRTKQSKWLEQSLQDMGDKVETVLKLITQDGDSFAKRAEMYYKHRPELISFVEESFRAYQSLAERFDHISKELQNANSTLAAAFPDQFQYQIDDDDDFPSPRVPRKFPIIEKPPDPTIPKAPQKFPTKNITALMALTNAKKTPSKVGSKSTGQANKVPKSGLTKSEALTEIDKLQKQILTLQTEKEYAKGSYECGYTKYWNIEEEMTGMQERISKLQDEFGISQPIDDDEARTVMAEAAIKSCQETLAQLQEKQEKGAEGAKRERRRIMDARDRLRSLKGELGNVTGDQTDTSGTGDHLKKDENWSSFNDETEVLRESDDMEMLRGKIKEHLDVGATSRLSVSEMAEKIDELVNKVINLETSVSSQTALIHRLRSETDELQSHIQKLEDDRAKPIEGKDLTDKVSEMENKLKGLHDLDRTFQQHNSSLQTYFSEARSKLDTISKKLHDVKPDEEFEKSSQSQDYEEITAVADKKTELVQDLNEKHTNFSIVTDIEGGEGISQQKSNFESPVHPKMNEPQTHIQPSLEESKSSTLVIGQLNEPFNSKADKPGNPQETQQQPAPLSTNAARSEEIPISKAGESVNPRGTQQQPITLLTNKPVTRVIQLEEMTNSKAKETGNLQGTRQTLSTNELVTPQEVQSEEAPERPVNHQGTQHLASTLPTNEQGSHDFQKIAPASAPNDEPVTLEDILPRESVSVPNDIQQGQTRKEEEDEPDWQQLFMKGLGGNEKVILAEYTNTLRNYKEAKKRLAEIEKKSPADVSGIEAQLRELRNYNATKDEEIRSLRQKLNTMQRRLEEYKNENDVSHEEEEEDISITVVVDEQGISPVEKKLRADIDGILEENLDFWMRFSVSFGQIQKFQDGVEDLFSEIAKLEKKKEGSSHGTAPPSLKSDMKPIYKHLREIKTELAVWLEQSEKLKEELLQRRFSQLCNIQEEIRYALNAGAADDDMKFTSYNAAKFQGEVANMQQENHKVSDELEAGMDHISSLQVEVERTIIRLNEDLGLAGTKSQKDNQMRSGSKGRVVPLKSFIFGVKLKQQRKKQSVFSLMHPTMMHRRYHQLKPDKSP